MDLTGLFFMWLLQQSKCKATPAWPGKSSPPPRDPFASKFAPKTTPVAKAPAQQHAPASPQSPAVQRADHRGLKHSDLPLHARK